MRKYHLFRIGFFFIICIFFNGCGTHHQSSSPKSIDQSSTASPNPNTVSNSSSSKGLTLRQIQQVIVKQAASFQQCYQAMLHIHPTLQGNIKVLFEISGSDGTVVSTKIQQSTLHNQNLEECVMNEAKKLKFPSPHAHQNILIAYPFNFKNSGSTKN